MISIFHPSKRESASSQSIVLIAPVHSYRASEYMSAADRQKIPLVFITDGDPEITPFSRPGIRVDFSNSQSALNLILEELKFAEVQAVIAPDEKHVEIAANVSQCLNLPHNSIDSLQNSVHKHLARKSLQNANLPVPKFWLLELDEDLEDQIRDIQFPCVAKPVNLSASRGVIRANTQSQLKNAIERIKDIVQCELPSNQSLNILVEEYVAGTEHALEGYLSYGELETICIFDKPDPMEGPYFEETCYVTPSRLDEELQVKIEKTILEACLAYGLEMGPVHAEVRVSGSQVWILEVAARAIGGDCGRLFELATNSSLEDYILCKSVGKSRDSISFNRAAGVAMIPVTAGGILRRVEGVIEAQSVENILEVRLDVREGEKMIPWPEGSKYPGFIYSQAESPELVEHSLRKALSRINFVCMPEFPLIVENRV